jgi:hypothetical protein
MMVSTGCVQCHVVGVVLCCFVMCFINAPARIMCGAKAAGMVGIIMGMGEGVPAKNVSQTTQHGPTLSVNLVPIQEAALAAHPLQVDAVASQK